MARIYRRQDGYGEITSTHHAMDHGARQALIVPMNASIRHVETRDHSPSSQEDVSEVILRGRVIATVHEWCEPGNSCSYNSHIVLVGELPSSCRYEEECPE
jgi:hypothetical protein